MTQNHNHQHDPLPTRKLRRGMFATASAVLTALALAAPSPASAHASLQLYGESATPGGYGVLFVRIPHGCTGGLPTDTVELTIPAGFTSVRPQQVAGWNATRQMTGTTVTSVVWSGGSLPDTQFADFGVSVRYPAQPGTYGMKVVQRCGSSSATWDGADIPKVSVAPTIVTYPADMVAAAHEGKAHLVVDAAATMTGKKPQLTVSVDGKTVLKMRVSLDERGDASTTVPLTGRTVHGKKYEILDGAVFTLQNDGVVLAKFVLGEASVASTSGGHSGH